MTKKNTANKKFYTVEEMKKIRKSDFYREDLARYIGQNVVMEVSFYSFTPYCKGINKACLKGAQVVNINKTDLDRNDFVNVDHIWVLISKNVKIDPYKPIRIEGVPYEYAHKCGKRVFRNVGLDVCRVTQNCKYAI